MVTKNTFGNFNELSHFKNGDMVIFPSGIYQKVEETFCQYMRLITSFTENQYQETLNNLSTAERRQVENLESIVPDEAFSIIEAPLGKSQNIIFNTALAYLQNENLGDRTFKIDLVVGLSKENKLSIKPYVPKQYFDEEDKFLAKVNENSNEFLIAEYYFSTGTINTDCIHNVPVTKPHFAIMCNNFREGYSLTKDARYYTISHDPRSGINVTTMLDDKLRDNYFLTMRNTLDNEIQRLVSSKWDTSADNIIRYDVNPDITVGRFNKNIKLISTFKNLNLQTPLDKSEEVSDIEEDLQENSSEEVNDDVEEKQSKTTISTPPLHEEQEDDDDFSKEKIDVDGWGNINDEDSEWNSADSSVEDWEVTKK